MSYNENTMDNEHEIIHMKHSDGTYSNKLRNALPTVGSFSTIWLTVAFTIKSLKKEDQFSSDYVIKKWNRLGGVVLILRTETDPLLKLHYHGVLRLPKNFLLTRLQVRNYHIYTSPLPTLQDYNVWLKYINKQQPKSLKYPNIESGPRPKMFKNTC